MQPRNDASRRSPRLPNYNYAQSGAYFVTICVKDRKTLFGKIAGGEMSLSRFGHIVYSEWQNLPEHFPEIKLNEYVIMPNHMHGIIHIGAEPNDANKGGVPPPAGEETSPLRKPALGKIVAYYKYQTTKRINQVLGTPGFRVWQRNFYEHIIRSDESLYRIREYIINNPSQWEMDWDNPVVQSDSKKRADVLRAENDFWNKTRNLKP